MYWSTLAFYSTIYFVFLTRSTCDAFTIGGPVNTTSGTVRGKASSLRPDVSEYLGIPYAKAPTGDLRFAAPVPVDKSSGVINATAFGPDCQCNRIPMTQSHLGGPIGEKITTALGQADSILDEDCLSINVWGKPQQGEKKKAVMFWIYGGGFSIGSASPPVYDGSILADENDVIVVSFNYRLNIFGFSGAPGQPWNVGLLDQRLALEWTRDNIARFGGDPSRITVFGQSAGGFSTDFIAYGFPVDPIAHALIAHSGCVSSAVDSASNMTDIRRSWYNVSSTLGCGGPEAGEATVTCMRSKTPKQLLAATAPLTTGGMLGGFTPVGDGETLPQGLPERAEAGEFAKIPFMTGNTDNEAGFYLISALAYSNLTMAQVEAIPMRLIQPLLDLLTLSSFTCPSGEAAEYRAKQNVPVWRYRYYGGSYENTAIFPVGSAWHTGDLLPLFGTAASITGVEDSDYQAEASAYMRDAWTTFAKNPATGLKDKQKWPTFSRRTRSLVQLSLNEQTEATFIRNSQTDALCSILKLYEGISDDITKLFGRLGSSGVSSGLGSGLSGIFNQSLNSEDALRNTLDRISSIASDL